MDETQMVQFADLYWRANEDRITDDYFDPDKFGVPAVPGDRYIGALAVGHDPHAMRLDLPQPNLTAVFHDGRAYSLWFHATFDSDDPEASKAKNLRLMVAQSLATNLKGAVSDKIPNPFVFGTRFSAEVQTLGGMRSAISKSGLWSGTTLHAELLSRGGSRTSPEKARAARENQVKATRQAMVARAESDAEVATLIGRGMSIEEVAQELGRSVEAVMKARIRHERRNF